MKTSTTFNNGRLFHQGSPGAMEDLQQQRAMAARCGNSSLSSKSILKLLSFSSSSVSVSSAGSIISNVDSERDACESTPSITVTTAVAAVPPISARSLSISTMPMSPSTGTVSTSTPSSCPMNATSNNSSSALTFRGRGRKVGVVAPTSPSTSLSTASTLKDNLVTENPAHGIVECRDTPDVPPTLPAPSITFAVVEPTVPCLVQTTLPIDGSTVSTKNESCNIMQWLQEACPSDVVPKVLAFMGPQSFQVLSRTNRHWKAVLDSEATWKVLCEDLYKWKEGDEKPSSWKELYRLSPCIPVDYNSIHTALTLSNAPPVSASSVTAAPAGRTRRNNHQFRHVNDTIHDRNSENLLQRRSIRILLRPGHHHLREAITVQAIAGVSITLETLKLPSVYHCSSSHVRNQPFSHVAPTARANRSRLLIDPPLPPPAPPRSHAFCFLRCDRADQAVANGDASLAFDGYSVSSNSSHVSSDHHQANWQMEGQANTLSIANDKNTTTNLSGHATIILHTRRHNEPAFLVRQGQLVLKDIVVIHNCHGIDIWNGNSAIQLQPVISPDENVTTAATEPSDPPRPSAKLQSVKVTSQSGRGIVCIDGGSVDLRDCAVHDCAATGIYIGGPGSSRASLERTDVVRNGGGNKKNNRQGRRRGGGIARGHSGVYLEQGTARIAECNISHNTLTGVSAVSPTNAILRLSDSDLVGNGTYQLEMPPLGTVARRRSVTHNVNLRAPAISNGSTMRSGLLPSEYTVGETASLRRTDDNNMIHEHQLANI